MSEEPWPTNPFAYSPISGPIMAFSETDQPACPGGGCGQGFGPSMNDHYGFDPNTSNMCTGCGYEYIEVNGDCEVCGGKGTGVVRV